MLVRLHLPSSLPRDSSPGPVGSGSAEVQLTCAVIPLKSPDLAKSRLASVLSPVQRRALFFELARRGIVALRGARGIDRVIVATASDEVADFARGLGAEVFACERDEGTAAACRDAATHLATQGAAGVLMIAGDLPLVSGAAIERLLQAAASLSRGAMLVPDRRGLGTNALLCRPPRALAPCFGADSLAAHLALAAAHQLTTQLHRCDELALDLDVADDLDHLAALASAAGRGEPRTLAIGPGPVLGQGAATAPRARAGAVHDAA